MNQQMGCKHMLGRWLSQILWDGSPEPSRGVWTALESRPTIQRTRVSDSGSRIRGRRLEQCAVVAEDAHAPRAVERRDHGVNAEAAGIDFRQVEGRLALD